MSEFSYIGRKPCGCVVAAVYDDPSDKKAIAKEIARWVVSGLTVEHVTHQYVRENFTECPHKVVGEQQLPLFPEVQS